MVIKINHWQGICLYISQTFPLPLRERIKVRGYSPRSVLFQELVNPEPSA